VKLDDAPWKNDYARTEPDIRPSWNGPVMDEERPRSSSGQRHEQTLKALAVLTKAVDLLSIKLDDILTPERPSPMLSESDGEKSSPDVEPIRSLVAEQHQRVLESLLAQGRRIEALIERIDL